MRTIQRHSKNGACGADFNIITLLLQQVFKTRVHNKCDPHSCYAIDLKSQRQGRTISYALPETAASVAIAATVVCTEAAEVTEIPLRTCEDCRGSECKGEGFVLKKLSEASADKARLTAKNTATRYTVGLPNKWSYCTKCSASRSCTTCDGRGKLSL